MRVEVLYVAGCPSHSPAVKLVRDVLAAEEIATEIQEVLVSDEQMAAELKFLGSPSIRINGQDVARACHASQSFGLTCRLYLESKHIGLPRAELVHAAVREAQQRETV